MQDPLTIPHSWQQFIWLSIALILGYFSKHLPSLFRLRPSKAEEKKIEAEARQIDLNSTIHAGDVMLELLRQVAEAERTNTRLRKERDFARGQVEALEEDKRTWVALAEERIQAVEAEKRLLELQLDERIKIGDGT